MSIRKGTSIIAGNISQNIDSEFSLTSNNPVKNSVITNKLEQTLDYENISNCITEIPQDINLELNNSTLTLKAGSKVYVPDGFEQDGTTPKFYTITITSDNSATDEMTRTLWFGWNVEENTLVKCDGSQTGSPVASTYDYYYDSTTNMCYASISNGYVRSSLPFCVVKATSGSGITSIEKVFNGFGYIGSTVFALPGVKGLIPNGRNADGTLNNTEWVCSSVVIRTFSSSENHNMIFGFNGNQIGRDYIENVKYDEKLNLVFDANNNWRFTIIGFGKLTSGVISDFNIKTAFHAVDYNDTECMTKGALSNIVNSADKKVGDVYYTSAANNTSVYAPSGGKWLILYVVEVNISTAVLYLYSDDLYHKVGEIVNGGTQITQARNGYGAYVSLLKIA